MILLRFMSLSILPMFSSKSFIVSGLIFRSLIHFEFVFICDVGKYSNYILLHVAVQFSQPKLPNQDLNLRPSPLRNCVLNSKTVLQPLADGQGWL